MSDDLDTYNPITCRRHSEYELAIMHRVKIQLGWLDAHGKEHAGYLLPIDLFTRHGMEYLTACQADGRQLDIRLDKIIHSNVQEVIANPR